MELKILELAILGLAIQLFVIAIELNSVEKKVENLQVLILELLSDKWREENDNKLC